MFATLAAVSGMETYVYAVQEGADLFQKGFLADEEPGFEGAPTIGSRLAEAAEAGVTFQVCEATAVYRGIKHADLVDGAVIVGGMQLIDLTVGAEGVLSF